MTILANIVLIVVVLGCYWLPSIIGCLRRSPALFNIVVLNALLGWTVVGWAVAFTWAVRDSGRIAASTRARHFRSAAF
jgi:hypothetical protein